MANHKISLRWLSRFSSTEPKLGRYWIQAWDKHKGVLLVLCSQIFTATMALGVRLLETDHATSKDGMAPLQILFIRQSITSVLSGVYMWRTEVEDAPFGKRAIRPLLVSRAVGGFFGVFGFYYSLRDLAISEATVLTFMAPLISCFACSLLLKEPFVTSQKIAAIIALLGVLIIANPFPVFAVQQTSPISEPKTKTPSRHTIAVLFGLIGVLGVSWAYTTIRWIGKRAHPLISVTYFSVWCTLVSGTLLLFLPSAKFTMPSSLLQWLLLILIGFSGFLKQFLFTAGLAAEKGARPTNMVYTQLLIAIVMDKVVWDVTPGWGSLVGSVLIVGGAVVSAVALDGTMVGEKGELGDLEEVRPLQSLEIGEIEDGDVSLVGLEDVESK